MNQPNLTGIPRGLLPLVVLLSLLASAGCVAAQQSEVTREIAASPSELLRDFAADPPDPEVQRRAQRDISHVLLNHDTYPTTAVQELLNGLETIVLEGTAARVRTDAAMRLSTPGRRELTNPLAGTWARMRRVYERSDDPFVRSALVSSIPRLAEREEGLQLLRALAVAEPGAEAFPGSATIALATLVAMEQEGRAVLRELHDEGLVKDPEARHQLAELARRGFQWP